MEITNKFKLPEDCAIMADYSESLSNVNYPKEGDCVYTKTTKPVMLKCIIGSGGEGIVYEVDNNIVAKIYIEKRLTKGRQKKIELMASKNITIEGVCFPIDALYNKEGILIGYTMKRAYGTNLVNLFKKEDFFRKIFPKYMKKDIVEICILILDKIDQLHKYNIVLVDINLFNIMLGQNKEVYILDTDSFQIEGYPGLVGRKEFFPLEIRYTDYRKRLKNFEYDYYTVSILLFYLLMNGIHPYISIGNKMQENRDKGHFPYRVDPRESMFKVPSKNNLNSWLALPKPIKEMFFNTFNKDGKRYHPKNRANIELWLKHLYRYKTALVDGTLEAIMGPEALEVFPMTKYLF